MELTPELIRKHAHYLVEATTNVRAQTRRSKKGKVFNVKAHERELTQREFDILSDIANVRNYDVALDELSAGDKVGVRQLLKKGMIKKSDVDSGALSSLGIKTRRTVFALTAAGKKRLRDW